MRPADECKSAGKSGLSLSTRGDGKAKWKWSRGEATTCDELGNPDADTDYDVCIYDGTGGGTYELAAHFALPAGDGWERASSCRWTYKDRSGAIDGITGMKLTPRDAGRASIQISAEGEAAASRNAGSQRFERLQACNRRGAAAIAGHGYPIENRRVPSVNGTRSVGSH